MKEEMQLVVTYEPVVIGGMIGFGLIGIFVGQVLLAVTYTLLQAWIEDGLGKAD